MCHHRKPTSNDCRLLVNMSIPPPPLAIKLKLEVSPGGRFAVVNTPPPPSSMYGAKRPVRRLKFHRNTSGSKPPPYTVSVFDVTNAGIRSNPYSRLPRRQPLPISPVITFPMNTPAVQICASVRESRFSSPVALAIQGLMSQFPFFPTGAACSCAEAAQATNSSRVRLTIRVAAPNRASVFMIFLQCNSAANFLVVNT